MQISLPKQLLLDNINITLKAVSSRTTLPILECILVAADDNGIRLISNDLEMGVETKPITADRGAMVIAAGAVALEAKMFADIIRRMPEADITIKSDQSNLTVIKCGKTEFKILGFPAEEFPYLPEIEKDLSVKIKSDTLKNMIRQTIFAVAVEDSKPVFTGELFDIKPGELSVVAVDGYRVSHRTAEIETDIMLSAIIPAKTLSEINKILLNDDSDVGIYFTDRQVLFETEECTIVSRLLEGEFLRYQSVFPADFKTQVIVDRHDFLMSLERAALISSREVKKNPIRLEITPDSMIIRSNTESGASYEELSIEFIGEELDISFNPKYLIDVIKVIDETTVCIRLTAALNPCTITGLDNTQARYLVLPLRSAR